MGKIGFLENKIALQLDATKFQRLQRDASMPQKLYQEAFGKIAKSLEQAIKHAENEPEMGLAIARQCTRFIMEAIPDPVQDIGRSTTLSQFQTLEICLKEVRQPQEYLANMQRQFGPNLDPRNYIAGHDAFSSIIKSQRQKLYVESQGLNTQDEKNFCLKRRELLGAVERGYNRLRMQALGGRGALKKPR